MENRTYPQAGEVLFEKIEQLMPNEDKIVIDLQGGVSMPSMFLNVSIGRFIDKYGVDLLRQKISFANITVTQGERLKEYIKNYTPKKQ